ncbi:MAG: hypothetical protein QG599_1452 [Pseudomonadota bacterium]|nr:hypothetical protein [Pseudomonadota bacterium]
MFNLFKIFKQSVDTAVAIDDLLFSWLRCMESVEKFKSSGDGIDALVGYRNRILDELQRLATDLLRINHDLGREEQKARREPIYDRNPNYNGHYVVIRPRQHNDFMPDGHVSEPEMVLIFDPVPHQNAVARLRNQKEEAVANLRKLQTKLDRINSLISIMSSY